MIVGEKSDKSGAVELAGLNAMFICALIIPMLVPFVIVVVAFAWRVDAEAYMT